MTEPVTDIKPTKEELVVQLQQSEQTDGGPNEILRHHIAEFSNYGPVFKSLGYTVAGALLLPAIIAFIATLMSPAYELSQLRGAVTRGLFTLCLPLFTSLVLARALKKEGLAERHLGWSPILCGGLLKTLGAIIWVWLPLRFIYTGLETFAGGKWNDSLGRQLFIISMSAFAVGLWLTARAIVCWIKKFESENRLFGSIRNLTVRCLPVMPGSLAVMSALGYHFTAVEMSWRAMWTVLSMLGIAMIGGLIIRVLLIAQFGIKLRQLNRNENGEIHSKETIDIGAISSQVMRLIRATALVAMVVVGWQIWSNVIPVIHYLDDWELWHSATSQVDGVKDWITFRHLLIAVGVLAITLVLSRNLPGLLEITLLDRLPLDRGGRYAISFIVKYLVLVFGVLMAFEIVGFSWTSVQWLAGGLMLGLGFGLQEIFANVISGIIILIERPIRVGDVVTVNDVTGTVTSMQLRATTIKDMDFRELIVPNKKFITEDVMNWTLTDRRSRIVLNVGVAYGSDTQLVQESLMKVATRHPLVQSEPPPDVFFNEFGDSTLNFQLRVFIPSREIFAKVKHELNMQVDAEFRAKGIEIAFPQQDIYIKNLKDLPTSNAVSREESDGRKSESGESQTERKPHAAAPIFPTGGHLHAAPILPPGSTV
jgi:potassium efflux system protein